MFMLSSNGTSCEEGYRFFCQGGKSKWQEHLPWMRFRLIDAAREEFPVQRMCNVLGVSPSGYFGWRSRPACRRQQDDLILLAHIRSALALSNGTYGSPRMTRELRGLACNRPSADGSADEREWVQGSAKTPFQTHHRADLSYIWTREGWLYLAVVIDLFARRVVG